MRLLKDAPGIKRDDIAKMPDCPVCRNKLLDGTSITFYRVKVERAIANPQAIRRHVGLSIFLGSEGLAAVMGADEDLLKVFDRREVMVHEPCAHELHSLLQLWPDEEPAKPESEAVET